MNTNDIDGKDVVSLNVGPAYTYVGFESGVPNYHRRQVLGLLKSKLGARPEGFQFSPKYKAKQWDGYISLLERNRFPSGLLPLALEELEKHAEDLWCEVKVTTLQLPSVLAGDLYRYTLPSVMLRDYQIDAVRALLKEGRGVAHMATNAGKTLVMAAICELVGGRSVILTHKKELLHQIAKVLRNTTSMTIGKIGDGYKDMGRPITVAMVQTLHKLLGAPEFVEFAQTQDVLCIDECHHTSARTIYEIAMAIPAPWRFGFSGTPLKYDDLSDLRLMAVTGDVLIHVSNEQLIEEGYSAKPVVKMFGVECLWDSLEWGKAYDKLIVNNRERNEIVVAEAVKASQEGKVVLVLVDRIEHQIVLCDMFYNVGCYDYTAVNGADPTERRNEVLDQMRKGGGQVVVATDIFSEGVDVPALDVVILAAGGKSHIKLLQRVGRGLRRKSGDNIVEIVDFYDDTNKYLHKHSNLRKQTYVDEGFVVEIVPSP